MRVALRASGVWAGRVALLALVYGLAGELGLLFAVPPGYATLIWPPSGIAIGALAVFGWELWPGVLLGSFVLNASVSGALTPTDGLAATKLISAFCIGVGSSLQALVAQAILRRCADWPLRLQRVGQLVRLLMLSGPLTCVIAASIGVARLYSIGAVTSHVALKNWLAWWSGDTLGVLVFLPLTLAASSRDSLTWRGKSVGASVLAMMLAALIPLGLTAYAWQSTFATARVERQHVFERMALENESSLTQRMADYAQALVGGAGYLLGSESSSWRDWQTYVQTIDLRKNYPGITTLGYVAEVAANDVQAFVHRARADGRPEFDIHPKNGPPYYIVTYAEPRRADSNILGMNMAWEAQRRAAAEQARDSGESTLSSRLDLWGGTGRESGFLLFQPVYARSQPLATEAERRAALQGWIYAAINARSLLTNLTRSQGASLNLMIYDGAAEDPARLIYSDGAATSSASLFTVRKSLRYLNRTWLVVWNSTPSFDADSRSGEPLLVLVGGLLLTGLLVLLLVTFTVRRTDTMEWIAGERRYIVPIAIFLTGACAAFYLYRTLEYREARVIRGIVTERATKIRRLADSQTRSKLSALTRMARRWDAAGGTPEGLWRKDVSNYVDQLHGLRAMQWVDAHNEVRWVEPMGGNEQSAALQLPFDASRLNDATWTASQDVVALTGPVQLAPGYRVIVVYEPVERDGKFDGFVTALFDPNDFFADSIDAQIANDFDVHLVSQTQSLFESHLAAGDVDWPFAQASSLEVYGQRWTLLLAPSEEFTARNRTWLPHTTLGAGLLIAALLAFAIRAVLLAKLRAAYLTETSELNEAIMSSAANPIIASDANGVVVIFNKAAELALGYTAEEVIGKHTPMLWHDPDEAASRARELTEELGRPVASGREAIVVKARLEGVETREWTFRRKDGTRFPVKLTITPLRQRHGESLGFLAMVEDITARRAAERERQEAEERLRRSEGTFRLAMEVASIGMALVTPDGRFMKVNNALCSLLGYSDQELLANDFQSITHPDDLALDLELVRAVLAGKIAHYRLEKRYYHKSGRVIWTLLSVSLVRDSEGRPSYFVSQIQDISEQKDMERIKNEFVSMVSHELRTPLTSIRGSLGLILGTLAPELPAKALSLLDIAHTNSERLILLINDILDIDKIASGQMRFDLQPRSLAQITRKAVQVMEAYALKFSVQIELQPVDERLRVIVDEDRFIQVLYNLLSNAVKFSPPQGKVRVSVTTDSNVVRLSVTDSGPGIPEEFRARIYEKFSQADSSTRRKAGGTGLGLHITRQIVEKMNGTIGFDSEVGWGTTFWIEFPALTRREIRVPDTLPTADAHPCPTILHVEDDVDLSNMLAALLHGRARLVLATDLQQAQLQLAQQAFALILLDLSLPDGSALELLDRLRELDESPPPIVVLCAEAPPPEVSASVAAVMVKTRVSESRIVETIMSVLESPPVAQAG